jgi:polysaccharide deacetylase family sporulation protein PdaB
VRWRWFKTVFLIVLIFALMVGSYLLKENNIQVNNENYEIPIYKVDRENKVISLTFDVNWAETDYIDSILDTLDKYNVKATFFIMGGWVNYSDENLNKLKSIDERGHEIGNHSYLHPSFNKIGEAKMLEELSKTDKIIESTIGKKPKLFRFPSGEYNNLSCRIVREKGYIPIQWDVDSVDWKEQGEDVEYSRVKKKIKPGSIILFHNNAKYTPRNIEKLLKEFSEEGYQFIPITELIYSENMYIDRNGTQFRKYF